jgi:hypothetical protein
MKINVSSEGGRDVMKAHLAIANPPQPPAEPPEPQPCRACKRKDREIGALKAQIDRLVRAVQRDSDQYERRAVHDGKRAGVRTGERR